MAKAPSAPAQKPRAPQQQGKAPGKGQPRKPADGGAAPAAKTRPKGTGEVAPRLKQRFHQTVVAGLLKERGYTNTWQVPRLHKVVINMGVGEGRDNAKILDFATADLQAISGQKPVITRAKKSIANFKLREGVPIGAKVTLRGARMYEFLDRLINVALPASVTSRACRRRASTAAATTRSACGSSSSFPRSSTTRSTRSEAWTSTS